ncbi:MAG: radical SAM protein [Chloroflexi bacterium]|nr:radical SAM protein [Chloroflexota bacterium]
MIGVSKLLCGVPGPGDYLRYDNNVHRRPVVVWNCTQRCNLHCIHCYAESQDRDYPGEFTTAEGLALIDSLAGYGVPVLLFSGGEPFVRPDLLTLVEHAVGRGLRTVISTNGTLITREVAGRLKETGITYVGVSLDGPPSIHDHFRGAQGAFEASLAGIRNCRQAGLRVGVRTTLTRYNARALGDIFDVVEQEGIPRLCFYHLVYAGRGTRIREATLAPEQTRQAVDFIFQHTAELHHRGHPVEVLTVDNHADAPYLYLRVKEQRPERAAQTYGLLRLNGGNSSGVGIGDIDSQGRVHADQFWRHYTFGNVRERPFSEIWEDTSDPLLAGLKDRRTLLKGRCARCQWLDLCGGNFRVRAEAVHGDVWAPDPACYLTDAEIGVA